MIVFLHSYYSIYKLEQAYDIYQDFLYAVKNKEIEKFKETIEKYKNISNNYIKTVIVTFKKYLKYIGNSLKYSYSNGGVEGLNNKIKVIKRIGFGYRSFLNLRRRILIMSNLIEIRK
ncbi:MAG: transposase [Fusobacteriaceae bacterium]|jgi:transposase|nr:transposase [Fusobacteriales bacterium]MDN5304885.1 transposase [Fusobacteriaceae bacterium]